MKKTPGLMFVFAALAVALVAAPAFAQTPVAPQPAPRLTVATPVVSPAPTVEATLVTPPVAAPAPTVRPTALTTTVAPVAVSQPPTSAPRLVSPQGVPPAPPAPPAPPEPPEPAQAPAAQKPPAAAKPPAPPRPAEPPQPPDPPAPGRERIDPDPVNIRFEVTIAYQSGSAAPVKRGAVLTVANNTGGPGFDRASLRSGNNVPVPTTTFKPATDDPAGKPVMSYQYRSVGLNVDVRNAAVVPGNRVRATLNVEFSGVDEKASMASAPAPSFPTFSQSLSLYFENGKPVLVAQSSDVVDNVERKQTVEVKATILR